MIPVVVALTSVPLVTSSCFLAEAACFVLATAFGFCFAATAPAGVFVDPAGLVPAAAPVGELDVELAEDSDGSFKKLNGFSSVSAGDSGACTSCV